MAVVVQKEGVSLACKEASRKCQGDRNELFKETETEKGMSVCTMKIAHEEELCIALFYFMTSTYYPPLPLLLYMPGI